MEFKEKRDVRVRGADGKLLAIAGVGHVFARDRDATFWKRLTVVVTNEGNHVLISLKDQKRLMLLSETYPKFLGQGKDSRIKPSKKRQAAQCDSGVESTSDSDEDSSTDHNHKDINDKYSMFAGEIGEDEIEVVEACQVGNEALIEVRFPEGKNMSSIECKEANAVAVMHKLGKHAAQ